MQNSEYKLGLNPYRWFKRGIHHLHGKLFTEELHQYFDKQVYEEVDHFLSGWNHGFDYVVEYFRANGKLPDSKKPEAAKHCLLEYWDEQKKETKLK